MSSIRNPGRSRANLGPRWRLLFGVVTLAAGFLLWHQSQPFDHGVITTGIAVGEHYDSGVRSGSAYIAVIEFHDQQGVVHSINDSSGTGKHVKIGSKRTVSYPADHPGKARVIGNGNETWAWIIMALGAVLIVSSSPLFRLIFDVRARPDLRRQ